MIQRHEQRGAMGAPSRRVSDSLRSRQADAISAQLQLQQSRLQQQQQTNEIIIEVRNAQYALEQDRAAVFAAQKAVTYQQQTLDAARKEFSLGATTITTVITDQTNLATAQGNLLTALANYQDARVNLDQLTGRMTAAPAAVRPASVCSNRPVRTSETARPSHVVVLLVRGIVTHPP